MTKLLPYKTERDEFKELLIKNLPARIKAGNEKHLSNIYEYKSVIALDKCKFINFNTNNRISFMVFDIDKIGDKTAKEYFKDIDGFFEYVSKKIGFEPTYILETQKGFHFAYHLKNHIYTKQEKALKYLLDIKRAITKLLECDEIASHRLWGVWRNPLLHPYYYSRQINYELSDFRVLIPKVEYKNSCVSLKNKIDEKELIEGKRNKTLFKYAMRFAKGQKSLMQNDILNYLIDINESKEVSLENGELNLIANSVFKYWVAGTIKHGAIPIKKDINEGIMDFEKMKNLSKEEYDAETTRRRRASAARTLRFRDKEKNKEQLLEAKKNFLIKREEEIRTKISTAALELAKMNLKVNIASISRFAVLDRKTVRKYYNF